jgi:hypothetical protein
MHTANEKTHIMKARFPIIEIPTDLTRPSDQPRESIYSVCIIMDAVELAFLTDFQPLALLRSQSS